MKLPLGEFFWYVNISLGDVLVTSGNKPLPEQILTQIYVAIWRHRATVDDK